MLAVDERTGFLAQGDGGQIRRLYLGGVVNAGRHAVREQIDQKAFLACRRSLEQFDEVGRLLCRKRKGGYARRGAFGSGLTVRSEERRVGKGWVSTCRSRGSPYH